MAVAAITAAVDRPRKRMPEPVLIDYPMLNDAGTIPAGALVNLDSTGYAVNAADTNGHLLCVGVAVETKTITTSQADGDETIRVDTNGIWRFGHNTGDAAITEVGTIMYVENNNAVDDASAASTGTVDVGTIVEWESADFVWVQINHLCKLATA